MSRFSGKSDVYDWFSDESDENIKNITIFIEECPIPLRIENRKDLIPLYGNLIRWVGMDNTTKIGSMSITRKPYCIERNSKHYIDELKKEMKINGYSDIDIHRWLYC